MKLRLLVLAIGVVTFVFVSGGIFGVLLSVYAFEALDCASNAAAVAQMVTHASQSRINLAADVSNHSDNTAEQALQMTWEVHTRIDGAVFRLHFRAMELVGETINRRLDAAEGATEALLKAWKMGFLKSCNLDSPELTLDEFLVQFLEQIQSFRSLPFKYIYYDEPNPVMSGQWTECGWGSSSNYTFYAMGNDQRYVYWEKSPKESPHYFLWKDADLSYNAYPLEELTFLQAADLFWVSSVYAEVLDGIVKPPALLYARSVATMAGANITGVFGVDMDMEFLSSSLRSGLVTVRSSAFVLDLEQNHVMLAHTFEELPLFINGSSPEGLTPFSVEEFPSPLVQACVAELVASFGYLEEVRTNGSEFSWNGTAYLYSTAVFRRRGLHWLAFQLTPKDEFLWEVSSSSGQLSSIVSEGEASAKVARTLQEGLAILSLNFKATLERTADAMSHVKVTAMQSMCLALATLVGCLGLICLVVLHIATVIRKLSLQMARVAAMQLDFLQGSPCRFQEIARLQQGFAMMVLSLGNYRHFLPAAVPKSRTAAHPNSFTDLHPTWSEGSTPSLPLGQPTSPNLVDVPAAAFPDFGEQSTSNSNELSLSWSPPGIALRFSSVLCINYVGTHRICRVITPAKFALKMAEAVALMMSCVGEGVFTIFFGDQLLAIYRKSDHCRAAVQAAMKLLSSALTARFRFTMGISYGRVMAGPMGCAGWRACNVLGVPVGMAVGLCRLCKAAEVDLLVDEGVMEKARFAYMFTPVAVVQGQKAGQAVA
eukprot:RCo017748